MKQERAATVGTGPHPGRGTREDICLLDSGPLCFKRSAVNKSMAVVQWLVQWNTVNYKGWIILTSAALTNGQSCVMRAQRPVIVIQIGYRWTLCKIVFRLHQSSTNVKGKYRNLSDKIQFLYCITIYSIYSAWFAVGTQEITYESSVLVNMQRLMQTNVSLDTVRVIQLADKCCGQTKMRPLSLFWHIAKTSAC